MFGWNYPCGSRFKENSKYFRNYKNPLHNVFDIDIMIDWLYIVWRPARKYYITIAVEGLQDLFWACDQHYGLCMNREGFFIAQHLLWHGASV